MAQTQTLLDRIILNPQSDGLTFTRGFLVQFAPDTPEADAFVIAYGDLCAYTVRRDGSSALTATYADGAWKAQGSAAQVSASEDWNISG